MARAAAADPVKRTDLAGDSLPPGAVARIGTVRFLPHPYLEQVFFTPDGATVVGRGSDNVVSFWEATTGRPTGELRDPDLMNFRVDQSPDGKYLALFGHDKRGKPAPDATLRVYDLATRKPVWTQVIDDLYQYYFAVRYSPDGKFLITATNAELRVWDATTGATVTRQKGTIGHSGIAMSPDGRLIAGGEQALWVWDWQAGGPPRPMRLHPQRRFFNYLAFSPDSKTIYVQEYGRPADGYDAATGDFTGKADEAVVRWTGTSPDGKTVATAHYDRDKQEGWVLLRDAASGKEVGRLSSGPHVISIGRWSKDGARLAGATAFKAWVWDVKTEKAFGPTVPGHTAPVTSLGFVSDGRLISASDDGTVRAWDPATGKELGQLLRPGERYWRLTPSTDGSLLAAAVQDRPSEVKVWDTKTGAEVYTLRWSTSRTGGVYRVVFTTDDQTLLTYGSDFHERAWDLATGKLRVERKVRPPALGPEPDEDQPSYVPFIDPRGVDVGADGDTLVLAAGKDATVYSVQTGKERFRVEADEQRVQSVVLSADGKRLATTGPGPVRAMPVPGMPNRPEDYQVTIWDVTQAKQLSRFRAAGTDFFPVLTFNPDGRRFVTGSKGDEGLQFWDATAGTAVGTIDLPRRPLRVAFSQDGKRLAVAFNDPTVLIFDVDAALKPGGK